jgi:diguanylate cyclase (GGDEF)-like protein/PAS domain S-box-containing protein
MVRILLIDDCPDDLTLAARELHRAFANIEVVKAKSPEEFDQNFCQGGFDVVVTDYQLRWSNGLKILDLVKRHYPDWPVLMFTNSGSQEIAVEAMKRGLDDYILKSPSHYSRLANAVKLAIERVEAQRRADRLAARLDSLLNQLAVGVFRADVNGHLQEANQAFLALLNASPDLDITGMSLSEIFPCRDSRAGQPLANSEAATYTWEGQLRCLKGALKWVSWSENVSLIEGETVIDGLVEDISDRKLSEAALCQSETLYRLVTENSRDLIALHDLQGRYLYISPSCKGLLGFDQEELIGLDPSQLLHPEDRMNFRFQESVLLPDEDFTAVTHQMRCKSGRYLWLETLIKPILNAAGDVVQIQSTARDVTERVHIQKQLENAVLYDALTELPNRTLFADRIDYALQRVSNREYLFAVLLIDLDQFKLVNDSLGHVIGDELLQSVSVALKSCIRSIDTLARLGGDEFGILVADIRGLAEALDISSQIRHALNRTFSVDMRDLRITASIGIALASTAYQSSLELLRDADIAMYRAKAAGKDRYEIFNRDMYTEVLHRLDLEHELRQAIENEEFVLHYQPKIDLSTGSLVGFEALVRWQHPQRGLLFPDAFIAIVEDTGLVLCLGAWVLLKACQQLQAWKRQYPSANALYMAVNVTAKQLQEPAFLDQVDAVLNATQLPGECLYLEITESVLLEETAQISATLNALREKGIQICIDDFGTGYSSLIYLQKFPIDVLKIDKSFVGQIRPESSEKAEHIGIIRAILSLAETLDMLVVAEGIETDYQRQKLQALGCDIGQGYLFSRPLPLDQALNLIHRRQPPQG